MFQHKEFIVQQHAGIVWRQGKSFFNMIKTGFNGCLMHYTGTHTVGLHFNYFKFLKKT